MSNAQEDTFVSFGPDAYFKDCFLLKTNHKQRTFINFFDSDVLALFCLFFFVALVP